MEKGARVGESKSKLDSVVNKVIGQIEFVFSTVFRVQPS